MAQIINNQSSGDYRSQKSNFWGGSIFFSFFTRNDPDHEEGDNDDDDCICGNDDNFHQKFSSLNPSRINIKRVDISLKQQIVEVIKLVGGWFAWGSALSSPGWRSPVSGRVNHISGPVAPIYTTATTPPYICNSRAQVPNRPKMTKKFPCTLNLPFIASLVARVSSILFNRSAF